MSPDPLDDLIHDVRSRCASLTGAAALLRESSEAERRQLLKLMHDAARALESTLARAPKG